MIAEVRGVGWGRRRRRPRRAVRMGARARGMLRGLYAPVAEQAVWEWAAEHVDFRREEAYETELQAQYDPEYMPIWKEPADAVNRLETAEVWILKCSRAGASENCLLNPLRYVVARAPRPALYVSGDQKGTETFYEKRIRLGLRLSAETAAELRQARVLEHAIYFRRMDLQVAWPTNRMAFRQHGYSLILADEVSKWPRYIVPVLRKRTDNYAFSTIVGISSPDAENKRESGKDPIFQEWEHTDQRYWMMPDPRTGRRFRFVLTSREKADFATWEPDRQTAGLKWDPGAQREDKSWDLNRVRETAYYLTPDGTVIREEDRLGLIAQGQWVASNPDGIRGREGYHVNAFYLPFKSGEFGHIACAFLEAKARGPMFLRVFVYEFLAEPWEGSKETVQDDVLFDRLGEYGRGEKPSECSEYFEIWAKRRSLVLLTQDVQKAHFWWVAREWIEGGDSGLLDFGYAVSWAQMEQLADQVGAFDWFCDNGYEKRRMEVFENAVHRRFVPVEGNERVGLPFKRSEVDPFEGGPRTAAKTLVKMYSWRTSLFKGLLMDLMLGDADRKWLIPKGMDYADRAEPDRVVIGFGEYQRQVTAEECVDGEWRLRRGHPENHLWDCEVMQLFGATVHGFYRNVLVSGGEG